MYNIFDISDWNYENLNVSGSKEKRWYRFPDTNELVLFKLPVSLTSSTWKLEEFVTKLLKTRRDYMLREFANENLQ